MCVKHKYYSCCCLIAIRCASVIGEIRIECISRKAYLRYNDVEFKTLWNAFTIIQVNALEMRVRVSVVCYWIHTLYLIVFMSNFCTVVQVNARETKRTHSALAETMKYKNKCCTYIVIHVEYLCLCGDFSFICRQFPNSRHLLTPQVNERNVWSFDDFEHFLYFYFDFVFKSDGVNRINWIPSIELYEEPHLFGGLLLVIFGKFA